MEQYRKTNEIKEKVLKANQTCICLYISRASSRVTFTYNQSLFPLSLILHPCTSKSIKVNTSPTCVDGPLSSLWSLKSFVWKEASVEAALLKAERAFCKREEDIWGRRQLHGHHHGIPQREREDTLSRESIACERTATLVALVSTLSRNSFPLVSLFS